MQNTVDAKWSGWNESEVVSTAVQYVPDGQQKSSNANNGSNSIHSSADLETAITKAGHGKFNVALMLLAFPASCTIGFDTGSMSYVIPSASIDLHLTSTGQALLQSACYAGMVVSGMLWGFMSDAFGRRKPLIIGFILDALMNVLAGAFPVLSLMVVFKFLDGCMIAGAYPIFATYLAEVYPIRGRDLAVLSMGLYAAIGQIIQAGLAMWIIPAEIPSAIPFTSWQLFQMIGALPSLISGIGCIFFVESPKFLADKGDHEGTLKVCQTIYSINTGNKRSTYPIKMLNHKSRDNENKSNLTKFLEGMDIFKPPFLQKTVIVTALFLEAVGLFNILRLWLPEMLTLISSSTLDQEEGVCPLLQQGSLGRNNLTSDDLNGEEVYSDMMIVTIGCLVGQALFLLLVGYTGKKIMQLFCALSATVLSIVILYVNADHIIIVTPIYVALYDICIFCDINIAVEVFPTRVRATSAGFMMLVAKMGTLVLNFIVSSYGYTYCDNLFYGMALSSLIMAALVLLIPKKPIEDPYLNPSFKRKIKI